MLSSFRQGFPLALGLLLVFAACDSGEEPPPPQTIFEGYDQNDDGGIDYDEYTVLLSRVEYRGGGTNLFGFFDDDENEEYSREEFDNFARLTFDPQDNGISQSEFDAGARFFFGSENNQNFLDYDTDESGTIEDDGEFATYLEDTELFDDFNTSGNDVLSPEELAIGVFGVVDVDGNEELNEDEFYDGAETLFDEEVSREPIEATAARGASVLSQLGASR